MIRKNLTHLAALAGLTMFLLPGTVRAQDTPSQSLVVQAVVKGTVPETLSALRKIVSDNGMMVMGELHQGKVLEMTGLKVKSESIFVGNPAVGKKLFEIDPGAGVALPVRVNIYENAQGQTVVAYIPPSAQLAGFGNPMLDKAVAMLDGKLASLTSMLGK